MRKEGKLKGPDEGRLAGTSEVEGEAMTAFREGQEEIMGEGENKSLQVPVYILSKRQQVL